MRNFLARRPAWLRFFLNPSQRIIGVFLIFILLPGTFLGVFAFRVLRQEEQLVKQRTKENLVRIAQELGRVLNSEFKVWDDSAGLAVESGRSGSDLFPEIFQQAIEGPGDGILLFRAKGDLIFYPTSALLFLLSSPSVSQTPPIRPPAGFLKAESLEIKLKNFTRAIHAYQKLLESADTETKALLLKHLARTLRKAGRFDEAADTYRELQVLDSVWLGGLSSDFIGRCELCFLASARGETAQLGALSLSLYQDLVGGKWRLEESRYMYYADRCRSWCQESGVDPAEFARLKMIEERKLSLTRAARKFLIEPNRLISDKSTTHLCFWRSDPFAAVILSENILRQHWWPRILSSQGEDLESVIFSSDGNVLFGSPAMDAPPFAVEHNMSIDNLTWRIQVWPKNPEIIQRDVRQRQYLFSGILVFIGAFLVFGSYITVRIVRRELEFSRIRADFVSTVSHEFRSPLTGIRQLGEMLLDGRVAEKQKQNQYFKMIVQESKRLTRLVENILDFTRMEEGRKEYRFEPINTAQWLHKLAVDFEKEITTVGVAVEVSVPEPLPAISADSEALGSAIHNLLDNAVKYCPGKKVVWLDAELSGGEVRIAVRDKGVGISESDLKHIFARFYRAKGEITKRVKGAGIGLNLVRHIVTAHNGRIECESKVGEGSTFSIWIPVLSPIEGGKSE